jgi:protein DGCR14
LYKAEEDSKKEQKEMMQLPSLEEQAHDTKRPLMVDTWGYRNKNYIMYVPDGKIELNCRNHTINGH